MQLLLRRRQSPQDLNLAVLQPLFVMWRSWRWQLQRCPVAPEDDAWHVRVALRPDIATAVVFPAKARRDDQLVQEKHMACDAMLNIAAILTVSMSSRCRQLISAIIIATVSTSGAAARRGGPQRARLMPLAACLATTHCDSRAIVGNHHSTAAEPTRCEQPAWLVLMQRAGREGPVWRA